MSDPAGEAPPSPGKLNPAVAAFEYTHSPSTTPTRSGGGNRGTSPDAPAAESLQDSLKRHLSYYFSDENLAKDGYLVSQMNDELFVPCTLLAGFRAISTRTNDLALVVETLRTCDNVLVSADGASARPKNFAYFQQPRGALILPDADYSSSQDVEKLVGGGGGKVKSVVADATAADSKRWYVQFEGGEGAAADALRMLTEKGVAGASLKSTGTLKEGAIVPPQYPAGPPAVRTQAHDLPTNLQENIIIATAYNYEDTQLEVELLPKTAVVKELHDT